MTQFHDVVGGVQSFVVSLPTGQDDLIVGTPIANRNRLETEGLIGFFVNALVLRTDLSGDPQFSGAFAPSAGGMFGAYGHQDLPFDSAGRGIAPEAGLEPQSALSGDVRAAQCASLRSIELRA